MINCFAACLNLFRRHESKLDHAKNIRNNFLTCFEKFYFFMNFLLMLFGLIMVVTGTAFVIHDLWGDSQFLLGKVKAMATALVVCYCFIVPIFGCAGMMIIKYRSCHMGCVGLYGVLIFFVVACPLMGEGSALLQISRVSNEEIEGMCNKTMEEVNMEEGRFVRAFLSNAHRFDLMSQQLLDRYMCSEQCPCLNYNTSKGMSTKEIFKQDLRMIYLHNRTFSKFDGFGKPIKPTYMTFTDDPEEGYKNFVDCYSAWEKQAEEKKNVDLSIVFKIDHETFLERGPGKFRKKRNQERTYNYIMKHFTEMQMFMELEDEFHCSGMCKSSLFYFNNNLDQGPPKQTCLIHFKEFLSDQSYAFGVNSVLCGVTAFFLFLFHFGLYCRPVQQEDEGPNLEDLQGNTGLEMPHMSDQQNYAIPNNSRDHKYRENP